MNIYNLSLLFISILHTCNSTISVTAPGLQTLAIDILPDMTLRDIQQQLHSQQSTSYDGIRFGGKEYLFNDNPQLSDIGIGPESSVEAFYNKAYSDCYFLTQIFDQTNVYHVLQNWRNVSDIHSNECCLGWKGIECNQNDKISQITTGISLRGKHLRGTLDLSNLVSISSLKKLTISYSELTGTIDLTRLPPSLEWISFSRNQFSGTVDLTTLPNTLNALDLENNLFTGTPDLTHLPASLRYLYLNNNQFTGTPDLTRLPASLTYLCLDYNQFTGFVNLTALPSSLKVSISNTGISTTI